jgi:hypothetical protein
MEVINLLLPFLSTPRNYAQILTKLASFAFYETFFITFALRTNPSVNAAFLRPETWGHVEKTGINPSGIVIAAAVAILTHMFQFHDRISDVLGIRRRFDRKHILLPLARSVGVHITKHKEDEIKTRRHKLMHAVFYRYASSRDENPLVDKHDIEHALNAWSWYWVFVEATAYLVVGAIVAWWVGSPDIAKNFLIVMTGTLIIASIQRLRLPSYARPQIERIAADPVASAEVKGQFDAL